MRSLPNNLRLAGGGDGRIGDNVFRLSHYLLLRISNPIAAKPFALAMVLKF